MPGTINLAKNPWFGSSLASGDLISMILLTGIASEYSLNSSFVSHPSTHTIVQFSDHIREVSLLGSQQRNSTGQSAAPSPILRGKSNAPFSHDTQNSLNTVIDYVQQSFRVLSFICFPLWDRQVICDLSERYVKWMFLVSSGGCVTQMYRSHEAGLASMGQERGFC